MKLKHFMTIGAVISTLSAYGQKQDSTTPSLLIHKNEQKMDLSKLTNTQVKQAIESWQQGDREFFISFFTADPTLTDDGNPRDFSNFVKIACGHERFTSIDKVENNGLDIYGKFHTESWGDFKTYFKFHLSKEGKFDGLDIGQAKY
jgi:hypothetical protein